MFGILVQYVLFFDVDVHAPWHYGADVKRIIKIYNLHLHYLPSYSPDLNLIEPLWLWTRQEKTYNFDYSSIQEKANNLALLSLYGSVYSHSIKLKSKNNLDFWYFRKLNFGD